MGLSPGVLFWLGAMWVLSHPWYGITHDGIFYAAQALHALRVEHLKGDLFFVFGSQDDYSLFGKLYAAGVDRLGFGAASAGIWVGAQLLWFGATVLWLRKFLPARYLVLAAVTFAFPGYYSADGVFRFAESFLTARSIAEPLAILGIYAAVRGKMLVCGLALIASAITHPLMALPAIVATFFFVTFQRGRGATTGLLVAALTGSLITFGLLRLGALPSMDAAWFDAVAVRSPFVVMTEWRAVEWGRVLYPVAVVALLGFAEPSRFGVFLKALAACAGAGLMLALFAALTRWELGIQVQAWRWVWLCVWIAPIAALAAAVHGPGAWSLQRLLWLTVLPVMALQTQAWMDVAVWLCALHVLLLLLFLFRRLDDTRVARGIVAVLGLLVTLLAAGGGGLALYLALYPVRPLGPLEAPDAVQIFTLYLGWLVAGTLAVLILWRWSRPPVLVVLLAVLAAAIAADGRSTDQREIERLIESGLPDWAGLMPSGARVYWPDDLRMPWFVLERESYVNRSQLAGALFSRATALEGTRRLDNVRMLGGRHAVLDYRNPDTLALAGPPSRSDLEGACSDPILDFVVLDRVLGPTVGQPFENPVTGRTMHLHRCVDYRSRVNSGATTTRPIH